MKGCLNLIWLKVLYALNQASESVLHLFCTCTNTRNLWRQLCAWLANQNIMLPSNLEPQAAMLGLWNELMQDLTLINHFILMLKRYIYLKKKETTGPFFFGLKVYIKNMEATERKIALEREKLDFYHKKCYKLSHAL